MRFCWPSVITTNNAADYRPGLNGELSGSQYECRLATINVLHALFTKEGVFFEHNAYFFVPLSYVCCRVKLDGVGSVQLQGVVA